MKLDKILLQSLQQRDNAYPIIESLDRRTKTAQVKLSDQVTEVWTVHLLLPTNFEQCIVDDLHTEFYIIKNVQPED